MEEEAPAFVKSQQRKTLKNSSEPYMVTTQYTNKKQVKKFKQNHCHRRIFAQAVFGNFRCFSPRKECCEDWYNMF